MEKVEFKNSRNLRLVGNLYTSNSDTVIIMCHGFMSNKYSRGRFPRLAEAFNEAGFDALAFDFSGCGESDDDRLTMEGEVNDLKSGIEFVKSRGYKKIALYGHSLGTVICLKCCNSEIITIALSGAGTDSMKYNWDEFFTKEQMKELGELGYITETANEEVRKKIIVDRQMLTDFEEVNQRELLKNVTCPVLIIHGNNDEEELFLYEKSKRAMKLLPKGSRLEVIDGSNHSFMEYYDELICLVRDWFLEHLK